MLVNIIVRQVNVLVALAVVMYVVETTIVLGHAGRVRDVLVLVIRKKFVGHAGLIRDVLVLDIRKRLVVHAGLVRDVLVLVVITHCFVLHTFKMEIVLLACSEGELPVGEEPILV